MSYSEKSFQLVILTSSQFFYSLNLVLLYITCTALVMIFYSFVVIVIEHMGGNYVFSFMLALFSRTFTKTFS